MFDIFKIISWLKKNFTKKDLFLAFVIVGIYLVTRLINLDKFPIFNDEGIYIRWAKVAWHDASWRFISLTDGKQPLQTWGTIPFLKLFPNNALLAGRLFSVTTGFVALSGFFCLLFYLFGKKTAFTGSIIYVLTPYFLFYDRFAMVDSGVNAGFIWILFFSIILVKNIRFDIALLFGLIMGFSLLAKSSVRIFLALSIFAPLLILDRNWKKQPTKIINFYILFILSSLIALVIYNVQRLSPFFHFVAEKNKTFIMTVPEFLKNPFATFFHNIQIIPEYVFSELGFVIVIFAIFGLIRLIKKDLRLSLYLFTWIFISFVAIAFFSIVVFPRYLIFLGTIVIIFASYFFADLKNKALFLISAIILLAVNGFFIYTILFNFPHIPLPEIDQGQYIKGVTAGWGIKDIVEYARARSSTKRVIVMAEGDFGMSGDVLDVFVKPNDNIYIKGFWPLDEKNLIDYQKELDKNIVLVVFVHRQDFPSDWPIRLIKSYSKPSFPDAPKIYLFELTK